MGVKEAKASRNHVTFPDRPLQQTPCGLHGGQTQAQGWRCRRTRRPQRTTLAVVDALLSGDFQSIPRATGKISGATAVTWTCKPGLLVPSSTARKILETKATICNTARNTE